MTPIEIYKRLPCNNCGKCSAGTCMSFAVKLLRRLVPLSECTELEEEAKNEIEAMLSGTGDWKEKRLQELFKEVEKIGFSSIAKGIGAVVENEVLKIPYMGEAVCISADTFDQELAIWDKLLILMYIKQAGKRSLSGKWVAFRDLKDGMIRAESFRAACEGTLVRMYGNNKEGFLKRLIAMGAEKLTGFAADYSLVIHPLPKIPFLVLLWSGDEDFDPACKVLLDSTATEFLDIEALLYLGMALVRAMKG
jgi:hypothetical protein